MGPFYEGCLEQLTLYVRHRAWLAARPGKGKGRKSRAEVCNDDEKLGKTRTELLLPPLDAAEHLAEALFKIGPSTAGETISYQEIAAWSGLTGYVLNAWEAETLRSLSGEYLAEFHAAEDADRPAPYQTAERVVSRAEVSSRLLASFMRLAGKTA